jgi:hypothetical protein
MVYVRYLLNWFDVTSIIESQNYIPHCTHFSSYLCVCSIILGVGWDSVLDTMVVVRSGAQVRDPHPI